MKPEAHDYADLAKDAYHDRRGLVGDLSKTVTLNGHHYWVVDAQSSPSGFQATAYRAVDPPREVIIAYRGTQGIQDALVDTVMVADKVNPQEPDARAFTKRVLQYAREHGIPLDQVTVTGHSLGGTLAEIEAARFGLRGETFNAYGAVDLGYGIPEGGNRVTDYVVATDVVSAASRHYGRLVPLATAQDIAVLRASGYMDGHGKVLEVVQARAQAAHGIDNFAPERGGVSTLNTQALALAQANAAPIAAYDRDVHDTRENLRVVSKAPGSPMWVVARNAEFAGTLMTAGGYATEGLQAGGHLAAQEAVAARHTAERAAATISNMGHRAAAAVEHEVRIVTRTIESGVHTANEVVTQQAATMQRTATRVAEAVGNTAERVGNDAAHRLRELPEGLGAAEATVESALPGFNDAAHPQHAVYAALKARLPPGTSEDRLAQCTAACHAARLDRPEDLGQVYVTRTRALLLNHSLFGHMAEVDLTRPAPPVQDSLRQAARFDDQKRVQSARFSQPARGSVHLL